MSNSNRFYTFAVVLLTLLAFGIRVWQLNSVPPGGRDDELSNGLVLAQKVLDGDWQFYYPDASGHEGLYHALQAGSVAIFGRTYTGVRAVSVLLGTLTIPLTYAVGSILFNRKVGLLAAAVLAVSFWSLMYSRTGIRHVSTLMFMLPAFFFFWRAITDSHSRSLSLSKAEEQTGDMHRFGFGRLSRRYFDFAVAGVFMGIGFYTYFAARGIPLIVAAFCVYLLLVAPQQFKLHWRGIVLMFVVAGVLAIPLLITLNNQPEGLYRVEEVAKPLTAARDGDFSVIVDHVWRTLSMFHATGDDEFLYNIPFRPIFTPIIAIVFWSGIVISIVYVIQTIVDRFRSLRNPKSKIRNQPTPYLASAFLLMWWLAGIAPAFISVPAGSLGHTIIAQPATMIILALPTAYGVDILLKRWTSRVIRVAFIAVAMVALVLAVAARDLPDYFVEWPALGNTRFLYRADIDAIAETVAANPDLTDFAVSSLLAGPWDGQALQVGLNSRSAENEPQPRWYNPQRALILELHAEPAFIFHGYPEVDALFTDQIGAPVATAGAYQLGQLRAQNTGKTEVCFANHLCVVSAEYDPTTGTLDIVWRVAEALALPDKPLISYPPPPDVYDGPRLAVYTHLRDADRNVITGDDGLWVDPYSLQAGDSFVQRHFLFAPEELVDASIVFGLYDPLTGERILTDAGEDGVPVRP